jgi:hypothetical protein
MNQREFNRYLERDGHKCLHCGTTEGLVPQHRRNRGMGGSKARDVPSNIVVMCSAFNGDMEADATLASVAIAYGWKVQGEDAPELIPVYDMQAQGWYLLRDDYSREASHE